MERILVAMAECLTISTGEVLSAVALGPCIGVAVYDASAHIGGVLHFVLPDSAVNPARALAKPFMFADTGIPLLFDAVERLGASRNPMRVYAAGGAGMFESDPLHVSPAGHGGEIGKRNCLAVRRILWRAGVILHGEALGGGVSRTLQLDVGTGRVWLQEGGGRRDLNSERRMLCPSAS